MPVILKPCMNFTLSLDPSGCVTIVIPDRQTLAIISKIKGQSIYAFKKFYMYQGRLIFYTIADATFPV